MGTKEKIESVSHAFNEVFSKNGSFRSPFAKGSQALDFPITEPPAQVVAKLTRAPLGDQIRIFPVPVFLSKQDSEVLRTGTHQRALALQAAFADLVLGEQKWLKRHSKSDQDLILRIFSEDGIPLDDLRTIWHGKSPDEIRFTYGPDCSRKSDGTFVITEDNIGRIGASADIFPAIEALIETTSVRLAKTPTNDLATAILKFINDLGYRPDDPEVMGIVSRDDPTPSLEPRCIQNSRRREVLDKLGIYSTFFETISEGDRNKILTGKVKVLVNFDVRAWKPKKKEFYQTIFQRNGTHCFEAPGAKIMCSKRWLPFMDDMIQFFTNESAILPTQETHILSEPTLPRPFSDWVIKQIGKHNGEGVYIGADMTHEQVKACERDLKVQYEEHKKMFTSPLPLIKQKYLNPSYFAFRWKANLIESFSIEFRPFFYATAFKDGVIGNRLCAMLTPASGDTRNSLLRNAFLGVVICETEIGN